ncbi:MAG TPA: aminotransferase class I/II-fold pyridoxal phosphate-dependent enzyme [Thermoanaerobaculia bacterium]|nr:aminotransferase class I/II-fold pyridoxal phosphate-dependent enzyme [Thermoanaerobaculia bacterium]
MSATEVLSPSRPRFADRIGRIDTENAFKVGPLIREVEAGGQRVIRCNLGEPDFPLPAHIREEIKRQLDNDQTHYVDPQGILPLREAIAADVGRRRGLTIDPDRVVVFPGAKPPIGLSQEAYCDPGDEVIYPSPGFPIYESFTRYVGATPVPLFLTEETGFTVDPAELARRITARTRLIYLNFPSNPTGGVATAKELEALADVILRNAPADARVYSDEVYERILFDGARHVSIASVPEMESRTIIVSGVSKSYSWTGGRIGWAIFPTVEEAAVFKNLNINYFSCVPGYNQFGAKVAIEAAESDGEIAKMNAAFQQRRDSVVDGLNAIPGIHCHRPSGAFYVFPNIGGLCESLGAVERWESLDPIRRDTTSPSTLVQRFMLFRYAVATMDRRSFGRIGTEGKHFLRISIATGLDDLNEAVRRFAAAARDRAGFQEFLRNGRAFA